MQDGLFYQFSSDTSPISISVPSLLENPDTVFLRRLSYVCFRNLAKESQIQKFKVNKAKIIVIYNSKVLGSAQTEQMIKSIGKLARLIEKMKTSTKFKNEDPEMMLNEKYFFGLYDTFKNSRNGLKILNEVNKLPCLRIYREEDGSKGFFKQRCGMKSVQKMMNFVIDHSYEDFMFGSYDI